MTASAAEVAFQNDMIREMLKGGWKLGKADHYDREKALYTEDCLANAPKTQPKEWETYIKLYPNNPESVFLDYRTYQSGREAR